MQDETLSLRISKAEAHALCRRACRQGLSHSSLVRQALRAYGATAQPRPDRTGHDIIRHLPGRNRGKPADLSTHTEPLKDYGQ